MTSPTPLDKAETPLQVLLRRPERFCEPIINSFTAQIAILDETGMIIATSRSWREFAEANAPSVAKVCEGANYLKVCERATGPNAEEAAAVAAGIRSVLRGEEREFMLEYPCHGPQEKRWFTVCVTSFQAIGVSRAIVAHENVTRRKQAEMALQEMVKKLATGEARLRTLVQTIPDLIWLKDMEGVFLLCNPMFEQLMGAREADILGKTDYDFVDKELADFFRENDRKAMAAGKPSINEEWLTFAADGHRALCETIKTPMRDAEGQILGVLGIARDITERHQAEMQYRELAKELATKEARWRALVESLPDPVWVKDVNGVFLMCNPMFERILGLKEADILGKIAHDLLDRKVADSIRGNDLEALAAGEPRVSEIWFNSAALGRSILLEIIKTPMRDAEGQIIGVVNIGRDITERRQAEQGKEPGGA
jgi:PAS domain S-box-containing protein